MVVLMGSELEPAVVVGWDGGTLTLVGEASGVVVMEGVYRLSDFPHVVRPG